MNESESFLNELESESESFLTTSNFLEVLFGEDDSDDDDDDDSDDDNDDETNKSSNRSSSSSDDDEDDDNDDDEDDDDKRNILSNKKRKVEMSAVVDDDKNENNEDDDDDDDPTANNTNNTFKEWENNIGIYDTTDTNDDTTIGIDIGSNSILSVEDCNELISIHESEAHAGYINSLTITRISDLCYNYSQEEESSEESSGADEASQVSEVVVPIHLTLPIVRARYIIWKIVENHFRNCNNNNDLVLLLVPEFTSLTAWHKSSRGLKNHYDSNRTYLKDRHYSAILYLNNPTIQTTTTSTATDKHNDKNHPHPNNYHLNGFKGGDLIFQVPSTMSTPTMSSTTETSATAATSGAAAAAAATSASTAAAAKAAVKTSTSRSTSTLAAAAAAEAAVAVAIGKDDDELTTTTATSSSKPKPSTKMIIPKLGRLVCFPSSQAYIHRVNEITDGTRYTLTMWFTTIKSNSNNKSNKSSKSNKSNNNDDHYGKMEHLHSLQNYLKRNMLNDNFYRSSSLSTPPPPPPQPWETVEQAEQIHYDVLERAELVEGIPQLRNSRSNYAVVSSLSKTEIRQLIAFCWWKKGIPLGKYLLLLQLQDGEKEEEKTKATEVAKSNTNNDDDDDDNNKSSIRRSSAAINRFINYEWKKDYIQKRLHGLYSAFHRWKMNMNMNMNMNLKTTDINASNNNKKKNNKKKKNNSNTTTTTNDDDGITTPISMIPIMMITNVKDEEFIL